LISWSKGKLTLGKIQMVLLRTISFEFILEIILTEINWIEIYPCHLDFVWRNVKVFYLTSMIPYRPTNSFNWRRNISNCDVIDPEGPYQFQNSSL
jgi:hypothetical protein